MSMNPIASKILDHCNELAFLAEILDGGTSEELALSLGARAGLGKILQDISSDLAEIVIDWPEPEAPAAEEATA